MRRPSSRTSCRSACCRSCGVSTVIAEDTDYGSATITECQGKRMAAPRTKKQPGRQSCLDVSDLSWAALRARSRDTGRWARTVRDERLQTLDGRRRLQLIVAALRPMTRPTLEQRLVLILQRLPCALRISLVRRVDPIGRLLARQPSRRVHLDRQPLERRSAHGGAHCERAVPLRAPACAFGKGHASRVGVLRRSVEREGGGALLVGASAR